MNYLTIIIILILLFCVFQLGAQDKKEGFAITCTVAQNLTCPTGYSTYTGTDSGIKCRKSTTISYKPACEGGKSTSISYGTISSANGNFSSSEIKDRCMSKDIETDVISLCPDGYDFSSTGHCIKNTRRGKNILSSQICSNNGVKVGDECKYEFEYKDKVCPTGLINPWTNQNKTQKDTGKCCPENEPYYRNITNSGGLKCRATWSS